MGRIPLAPLIQNLLKRSIINPPALVPESLPVAVMVEILIHAPVKLIGIVDRHYDAVGGGMAHGEITECDLQMRFVAV